MTQLVRALVVASCVRRVYCRTGLPNSWVLKVYKKRKRRNREPLSVVELHSGCAVVVPLPLCPWYFQSIIMYAWYRYHRLARAGVGAALLCLLGTCQPDLLEVASGALDVVRTFNTQIGEIP